MKGLGSSVAPIISGVRTDCEKLLMRFIEVPSVRFEHFSKCFRDLQFSLMFAGRISEAELREFAEKILLIALNFCFPPYSFQVRIGGIYLMYSLYYTQPRKYYMPIRVTPKQFEALVSFIELVKQEQHCDTSYVFHKLVRDNAFHFTMFPDEYNPLNFHRHDVKEDTDKMDALKAEPSVLQEILSSDELEQIGAIHDQYWSLKCQLAGGPFGEEPSAALSLVNSNPSQFIEQLINECEARVGKKRKRMGFALVGAGSPSKNSDSSDRGGKRQKKSSTNRAELKRLAYKTFAAQTRSRRHRQVPDVADEVTPDTSHAPEILSPESEPVQLTKTPRSRKTRAKVQAIQKYSYKMTGKTKFRNHEVVPQTVDVPDVPIDTLIVKNSLTPAKEQATLEPKEKSAKKRNKGSQRSKRRSAKDEELQGAEPDVFAKGTTTAKAKRAASTKPKRSPGKEREVKSKSSGNVRRTKPDDDLDARVLHMDATLDRLAKAEKTKKAKKTKTKSTDLQSASPITPANISHAVEASSENIVKTKREPRRSPVKSSDDLFESTFGIAQTSRTRQGKKKSAVSS